MDIAAFILLPFLAFLGAWTSKKFRRDGVAKLVFVPPLVSFAVGWGWITVAKYTSMSLAVAQIVFDTTYVLSYFLSFLLLGETASSRQLMGAALAVFGIILLAK